MNINSQSCWTMTNATIFTEQIAWQWIRASTQTNASLFPEWSPGVEEGPPVNLGPRKNEVVKKQRTTKPNSGQSVPQQIPFHCLQWQLTRNTVWVRVGGSIKLEYPEVLPQMSSFLSPPWRASFTVSFEDKKELLNPRRQSFSDKKAPMCLSNDSRETVMSWGKNNNAVMSI